MSKVPRWKSCRATCKLFDTCRPVVLCEVIPDTAPAVTEFLSSRNYRIFDGQTPLAQRQPQGIAAWSTLAIPA